MSVHANLRAAHNEARCLKDAFRAHIMRANISDEARAELLLTADECVDEAMHDEIAQLEADEQERQAGIWHKERLEELRDYERRVF